MALPSIILFGDSITEQSFSTGKQGFGASLSDTYVRRADVLNRGIIATKISLAPEPYEEQT
jgi:hypothetical protein